MQKYEQLIMIKKWEWIPIIGTIIYILRVEFTLRKIGKKAKKEIKKSKNLFSFVFLIILLPFWIWFLVEEIIKDDHFNLMIFFIYLSLSLLQNITPYVFYVLYKKGLKKFKV